MAALRTLAFAIAFYGGTVFAVLGAFLVRPFGIGALRRHTVGWVRFHGWCCRHLLGITVRIEGQVPAAPVLVAAKHQAMFETFDLVRILGPVAVVMKQELAAIPLWGWVARAYGTIPIDRDGSAGALRVMLRSAQAALAEGRSILIFPEGTRVLPGESPPLKPGFAGLYRQLKVPVVPVALDSGRVWPKGRWAKRAGMVTVRFGDPIPPGLPRAEAEARVHAAINALERPSSARPAPAAAR